MSNAGPICAICLSAISNEDAKTACPACNAGYHTGCWQENGGCAVYGCSQAPAVESRRAIEIPLSYWGRENKNCPKCGQEILAAAVRCRHCGATFESARPQDAEEFQQRTELSRRLPALRRTVVCFFIFSVLTCLAPIAAVWGIIWYPKHREEIRALPALYDALCKIGLAVAIGQTIAVVVLTALYALVRR
ncbi:MAG: RING finger protein [Limisphaerales bacterium]